MFGFLGEIRMFTSDFAPRGWRFCDGSLIRISENQTLFVILGTAWGGDGVRTFALPDLRGRIPSGVGPGTGLSPRKIGDGKDFRGGGDSVTLGPEHMPPHRHAVALSDGGAAGSGVDAVAQDSTARFHEDGGGSMGHGATHNAGGGHPHPNLPPYLAVQFIICVDGLFPSRR